MFRKADSDDAYVLQDKKGTITGKRLFVASSTIGVVGLGLYLYTHYFGGAHDIHGDAFVDSKGLKWRKIKDAELMDRVVAPTKLRSTGEASTELLGFTQRPLIPHNFWTCKTECGQPEGYGLGHGHDYVVFKSSTTGKYLWAPDSPAVYNSLMRVNTVAPVGPFNKFKIVP